MCLFAVDAQFLRSVLLSVSVVLSILFLPYGLNFYVLMHRANDYTVATPNSRRKNPVTIQIPVFNELYVAERIIKACLRIADNYGKNLVQILVLDDSTDDTTKIVKEAITHCKDLGYEIDLIHREDRKGFKAGALENALPHTKHEYIAIFDADFLPPPDFLDRVMPHFEKNEVGLVQCRWAHINRDYNFITKAIAIGYDGHHLIEQAGRHAANFLINFNGSAGVVRKKALVEAGGWEADTLAEDLDASYRIQLNGWKGLYLRDVACHAEIPPSMPAVKKQQGRWACGSIRAFRKLVAAVAMDKRLSLGQKIEGMIHLSFYSVHPFMFAAYFLAVVAAVLDIRLVEFDWSTAFTAPVKQAGVQPDISLLRASLAYLQALGGSAYNAVYSMPEWVLLNVTIFFCAISMWIFYAHALKLQGIDPRGQVRSLGALGLIGFGISLSNTIAVTRGLMGRSPGIFNRTPKYRLERGSDTWRDKRYQISVDKIVLLEIIAGVIGAASILRAVLSPTPNIGIVPILFLYTAAYLYIARVSIKQAGKE